MKTQEKHIYTIGYGNRNIPDFFDLLNKFNIKILIDVRSVPYSKYNSDFQKKKLEIHCKKKGIEYMYMGDLLGGRPEEESNYFNGKVGYEILSENDSFRKGVSHLIDYSENDKTIVLMCSELKPENCHRSKLIGRELNKLEAEIIHIDENGNLKTQTEVMDIVTKGLGEFDLFGEKPLSSRKKYNK